MLFNNVFQRFQLAGIGLSGLLLSACQTTAPQPQLTDHARHTDFERDRQAILAMAGSYAVDFTFRETIAVRPDYETAEPYHSGGTEWVTVLEDADNRIVLQHVLVACGSDSEEQEEPAEEETTYTETLTANDQTSDYNEESADSDDEECFPIKHWRQDWIYQDQSLLEFRGNNRWENVSLPAEQVRGTWSQAVYQVDDSPRYEGYGRWQHDGNQSVWQSETTWRPLPRREYTVRDDYDVLVAINRHVITPNGWYHEQDNYKLDLSRNTDHPVIAREFGLNRYEPVDAPELSLASEYMHETEVFWAQVRNYWNQQLNRHQSLNIQSKVDDEAMYERMFELADEHTDAKTEASGRIQREIRNTLAAYVQAGHSD